MSERLDRELAERGLARSRSHARQLVDSGVVHLNGVVVTRASTTVSDADTLHVENTAETAYVSRAAGKLLHALDTFGIDPAGGVALDAGASTGGFTQVLLERGAERVLAVDVGHGQLAAPIAEHPRVTAVEGFNLRELTPEDWATWTGSDSPADLVVGDLSFISLRYVLGPLGEIVSPEGAMILLIKPQFEVGRQGVRGGLVDEAGRRAEAVTSVLGHAETLNWHCAALTSSPVVGTHGNREYLALFRRGPGRPTAEWADTITLMTGG